MPKKNAVQQISTFHSKYDKCVQLHDNMDYKQDLRWRYRKVYGRRQERVMITTERKMAFTTNTFRKSKRAKKMK